jgi:tetratricopeptide (TPR) repeat protein
VYFEERDFDRAMPLFERALAIEEKTLGPSHPHVAISLSSIANIVSVQGRHADAQRMLERAVAIAEAAEGPEHPTTAIMLRNLADVHHQAGDDAAALPLVERAVAIFDRHEGEQEGEPGGRFLLAKSLMATGGNPDRALLEATKALAQYRSASNAEKIEHVEAWLAVPLDRH